MIEDTGSIEKWYEWGSNGHVTNNKVQMLSNNNNDDITGKCHSHLCKHRYIHVHVHIDTYMHVSNSCSYYLKLDKQEREIMLVDVFSRNTPCRMPIQGYRCISKIMNYSHGTVIKKIKWTLKCMPIQQEKQI